MRIVNQTDNEPQNILDFESVHGLDLVVTERPKNLNPKNKYYACFHRSEIRGNNVLVGITGDGNTVDEAVVDYCKRISGETLVLGAYTSSRREIVVPELYYQKQ